MAKKFSPPTIVSTPVADEAAAVVVATTTATETITKVVTVNPDEVVVKITVVAVKTIL